jgi:methionine-rich copper-binding protein CopC
VITFRAVVVRLAVAALLAVTAGIGLAGPASAHDVLISSDPADGSTLSKVPTSMTFTFDQPVQNFDPVMSLVGPDGRQYVTGTPTISGSTVTGTVGTGPVGTYTGAYRVVSADGHPVTGEVHFKVTVSGGATGTAVGGAVLADGNSSGGLSGWLWAGLAVAAVVIAAAAVLLLRRPRAAQPAGSKEY